jgi:hypothetical protein
MKTERRLSDLPSEFPRPVAAARNIPIIVLISLMAFFAFGPALQAQELVGLGTADDFAVLSGESITNTGPTTITGDVGIHPGTSVTGFDSVTLDGELHETDAVAEQAKVDLVTAYDNAAGQPVTATVDTELGGETLIPGVYDSAAGTFGITGTLTLDAEGDPNAVFIFQMASTLVTASDSSVELINGADACNVFWQVGSSATLGTDSTFMGNIMALESITLNTGATVEGRVLARNGSVTLDSNTITQEACTAAAPEDTTTTTAAEDTTTTTAAEDTTTTTAAATTTTVAAPVGGVDTGGGSTSGTPNMILLLGGFSLLAAAVGAFVVRRRLQDRRLS